MIRIQTRQNRYGNWWCNTTYRCYDMFEEAKTIEQARKKMFSRLIANGADLKEFVFEQPKYYPKN